MKHGRKPTRRQCQKMKAVGLEPANWLVVKNQDDLMVVIHRNTGTSMEVPNA